MTKLKFLKLYFKKQWKFISRNAEFFEWEYSGYRLLYSSCGEFEDFHVEQPGYDMIKDVYQIDCRRNPIFGFFMLPAIREMARIELLKEIPKLRKHRRFVSHLEKKYPKTSKSIGEWFAMQSGIYRGYSTGTAIHEDYFSLAR